MSDALDWHEARRLAGYVRSRGRLGLHRQDADALMGGTAASRKAAFGLAWSRRWVDCCGPYLVVPPRSTGPGGSFPSPSSRTIRIGPPDLVTAAPAVQETLPLPRSRPGRRRG